MGERAIFDVVIYAMCPTVDLSRAKKIPAIAVAETDEMKDGKHSLLVDACSHEFYPKIEWMMD